MEQFTEYKYNISDHAPYRDKQSSSLIFFKEYQVSSYLINYFTASSWIRDTMIYQHSDDGAGLWLIALGQPIRVVATRLLVMRT
jgi:hypothetical protein